MVMALPTDVRNQWTPERFKISPLLRCGHFCSPNAEMPKTRNPAAGFLFHTAASLSMMTNPKWKKPKMMDEKSMALQKSLLMFDLHSSSADFLELGFLMKTVPSWKESRKIVAPPAKVRDAGNPRELLEMVPPEVRKELFSLLDNVDNTPKELREHFNSLLHQHPRDSGGADGFLLIKEHIKSQTLHRVFGSHDKGWLDDIAVTLYVKLLKI